MMSEDRTHTHHLQHPGANKGIFARLRAQEEGDSAKKAEAVLASFIKSKLAAQQRRQRSGHDGGGNNTSSAGNGLAVLPPKQQQGDIMPRETPTPPYCVRQQKKKRDEQVVVVRRTTQRKTGAPREDVNMKESWHEPPPPYRDANSPNFETGPERARYAERGAATLNRPRPSFDTAASITTIDSFDTFAACAPTPTPQTRPPQRCPIVARSSSRRTRGTNNNNNSSSNNNGTGHIQNNPAVVVHAKQPTTTAVGQGAAPAPPAPVVRSYPVHAELSPTSEPSTTPGSLTPPSTHLELLRSRNRGTSPVTVDSHSKQSSTLSGPGGGGRARSNPGAGREELDESCSLASILPGGTCSEQQRRSEPTWRRSDTAPGAKHLLGTPPPRVRPHPGSDLETSRQEQDPTSPMPGRGRAGERERGDKSGGGGGDSGDGGTPQPLIIRVAASNSFRSSPDKSQQGPRGNDNFPFSPMVVHRSPTPAFATSRSSYHTAAARSTGGDDATAEMRVRISENSEKEKAAKDVPALAAAARAAEAAAVEPAGAVDKPPVLMVPGDEPGSSPSASPPVWVTRHIDCSDTCGLVLVMSDSSVGLLFNDSTKMILGPGEDTLEYTEPSSLPTHKSELGAEGRACGGGDAAAAAPGCPRRSACGGATLYNYTLDSFPFYLLRKVAAVRYFREHLLPEGGSFVDRTGGGETGSTSPAVANAAVAVAGQGRQAPLAFIEKWQREGDSAERRAAKSFCGSRNAGRSPLWAGGGSEKPSRVRRRNTGRPRGRITT